MSAWRICWASTGSGWSVGVWQKRAVGKTKTPRQKADKRDRDRYIRRQIDYVNMFGLCFIRGESANQARWTIYRSAMFVAQGNARNVTFSPAGPANILLKSKKTTGIQRTICRFPVCLVRRIFKDLKSGDKR